MFLKENPIKIKARFKELLFDYSIICGYLFALYIITMLGYKLFLKEIPEFTKIQSQLVATFSSVIPITIIFSFLDYKPHYGTLGKRKNNLRVFYKTPTFTRSLIRNSVKFLPWQIAHISVIEGVYTEFESLISIVLYCISMILLTIMLLMGLFRKDKRHLGDIIAGTQVQLNE